MRLLLSLLFRRRLFLRKVFFLSKHHTTFPVVTRHGRATAWRQRRTCNYRSAGQLQACGRSRVAPWRAVQPLYAFRDLINLHICIQLSRYPRRVMSAFANSARALSGESRRNIIIIIISSCCLFLSVYLHFLMRIKICINCNCNWRICSAPPTISPMAHYTVKLSCLRRSIIKNEFD